MGGMRRALDGGYAEFCRVPVNNVQLLGEVRRSLGWAIIGVMPEMLQTAWRPLFRALKVKKGERFLIRGGATNNVGLPMRILRRIMVFLLPVRRGRRIGKE
jgi:NADPH:quinone reductase-like Zn-dependent oxidoreductase